MKCDLSGCAGCLFPTLASECCQYNGKSARGHYSSPSNVVGDFRSRKLPRLLSTVPAIARPFPAMTWPGAHYPLRRKAMQLIRLYMHTIAMRLQRRLHVPASGHHLVRTPLGVSRTRTSRPPLSSRTLVSGLSCASQGIGSI